MALCGIAVCHCGGLWLFGPREPALSLLLPTYEMDAPGDLDAYLASREAVYDDIVPGTEKSIIWADKAWRTKRYSDCLYSWV